MWLDAGLVYLDAIPPLQPLHLAWVLALTLCRAAVRDIKPISKSERNIPLRLDDTA
jgi:hypothetical protein